MTQTTTQPQTTQPTISLPAPTAVTRQAAPLPALGQMVLSEMRKMIRNPMFAVGTLGFPILWFALFGLPNVNEQMPDGTNVGRYILVSFGTYSLLTLAMYSFGLAVAAERTGGWLRLLRASPMPAPLYFLGKVGAALLFSGLSLGLLYTFAHFAGGVTLPLGLALTILGKLLLGSVPLIALGFMIGFLVNPTAANVIANVVSVLMSFASGLFVPLDDLPAVMQKLAPFLPTYHLAQIGWGTVTGHTSSELTHWLYLALYAVVFGGLAIWGLKRDEARGV
ncbi:ABC transporter permease [Deinococcus arenicola]|uniref:ABC transporter permease n=1 Tax=Deinococcus arenicola TaxID=2994950 RepID=A0ABU4DP79_9DEIO|nr:ABC transporter permease [Deinococcus sp. ZS9-10]MDV6373777.1 ABC transporter permease [Deinococcus sp. ZS9-10]